MKLFCLPYAGGSQFFFRQFKEQMPEEVQCVLLDYAGHGIRLDEPLADSFEDIIDDIDVQISNQIEEGECFSLFGYSMGGIVAYEIAKRHRNAVRHLFIAAFQPPNHLKDEKFTLDAASWEAFLDRFSDLNERILSDGRYRQIYLRPLKNDFRCLCEYSVQNFDRVVCGITVLYGTDDVFGPEIGKWKRFTEQEFGIHAFSGGHFFLKEHIEEIAALTSKKS